MSQLTKNLRIFIPTNYYGLRYTIGLVLGSESRDPGYVFQNLGSEIRKNLIPTPGIKKHQNRDTDFWQSNL
jgi:hypothetical protein